MLLYGIKKTIVNLFYFFLLYVGGGKGELGCSDFEGGGFLVFGSSVSVFYPPFLDALFYAEKDCLLNSIARLQCTQHHHKHILLL